MDKIGQGLNAIESRGSSLGRGLNAITNKFSGSPSAKVEKKSAEREETKGVQPETAKEPVSPRSPTSPTRKAKRDFHKEEDTSLEEIFGVPKKESGAGLDDIFDGR